MDLGKAARGCVYLYLPLAVACGAAPAQPASPAPAASAAPAPAPSAASPAEPPPSAEPAPAALKETAGFDEALALLRPAAAAPALAALEQAPSDAGAYANAALAYTSTDVPVMTLLWGMTYQAMGGGKEERAVAQAIAKVLSERVVVQTDPSTDRADYSVRFAPGQMPLRSDDEGAVEAPLAHVFEGLFSTTLVGFRPPWTVEEFYDSLSSWVGIVATRGTPLDEALPLHGWLVSLAKAGQLEAFCFRLLGPAYPAELKAYQRDNPRGLPALAEYLKANALVPALAPAPDTLVRLR